MQACGLTGALFPVPDVVFLLQDYMTLGCQKVPICWFWMTLTHMRHSISSVLWSTTAPPMTLRLYPCMWAHASVLTFIFQLVYSTKADSRGLAHVLYPLCLCYGHPGQSPHPIPKLCAMCQVVFHWLHLFPPSTFETIVLQCQWSLFWVCSGGGKVSHA